MLQDVTRVICVLIVAFGGTACTMPVQEDNRDGSMEIKSPFEQAVSAAKNGHVDKAIELFEKLIEADPKLAPAFTNLGLQYLQKNDLVQAEQALDKAVLIDKADFVAYTHLGVIKRNQGDFTVASEMYKTAIKYNPDYANAHLNIGILYDIYLYDLEPALYHYMKYQELTSDSDKLVHKWIVDLKRRVVANNKGKD